MQKRDIVTVYPSPTQDKYGHEDWGASEDYPARFVERATRTINQQGEAVMGEGRIHFESPFPDLSVGDRVDYEGVSYVILEVRKPKDQIGRVRLLYVIVKRRAT